MYPATTSMYTKTVNYWLRLKQLPESNISKHVYLYLLDLHNLGHRTWASDMINVLEKCNLEQLWNTDEICDTLKSKAIKKHTELLFRNQWFREVNVCSKNPKLRLYRNFKCDFNVEPYMYINVSKYRITISRLRLSSHHLAIETGRHAKPKIPIERRFCTACLDKIDDEIHFLIECKKYQKLRKHMFNTILSQVSDFNIRNSNSKNNFLEIMTI